ncbi:hypothetical protein LSH36_138g09025 [Paralvinella palmiformis]|uniref:F-box only protein 9 n=1 Tax=Paralvinella palmiformis TaxID=53620 RepID=A0AAD9N7Z5_9ANNE|nr:hypothetical protein LSH36_138g09025 [Paralvinella palmiformis]
MNLSQPTNDEDNSWFPWDLNENSDEQNIGEPVNVELELEHFRIQWQKELHNRPDASHVISNLEENDANDNQLVEPTVEEQARYLFIQGVNAEHGGRLYDAIKYYRRAVQLVPDIEFRIQDYRPRRRSETTDSESSLGSRANSKGTICEPNINTQVCHISALPWEILMYIFKWVVSVELDIPSLERLAEVCRGFYVCARDEELWKLICQKVYGMKCGRPGSYGSYRTMYIQKPHVRFNGCYISRHEYFRQGEKSLDGFYRPIHIVEYYRYVRFFTDGKLICSFLVYYRHQRQLLMLTSPDNPYTALPKLRHRSTKCQGILHGYYKVCGDQITAVLKRRHIIEHNPYQYRYKIRRQNHNNDNEQNFHVEFLLRNAGRRPHSQLMWNHYSVHTYYRLTGQDQIAEFDIGTKSYPSLIFSRVNSYTAFAETPLL